MLTVWLFICRFFCYLFMRLHLYRVKSWVYRYLFESQYLVYSLTLYTTLEALAAFLKTLIWKADSWLQLWDAISYPNTVEYIGYHGDKRVGDCDEFAIYTANALRKSLDYGHLRDVISQPMLLTVIWAVGYKPNGHNVCLLSFPSVLEPFGYMDYGMPTRYPSLRATVDGIVEHYTQGKGVCLGYTISDPVTLAPVTVSWR